jgi:hypothetical protein
MSLQRVFESARKLGLPVVVTDPSGREPFVLLPLDQFEALTSETERQAVKNEKKDENIQDENAHSSLYIAKKESSSLTQSPAQSVVQTEADLLLEERFYLGSEERES